MGIIIEQQSLMNENNSDICFKQVIAPTHRGRNLNEQVKSCVTEYFGLKTQFTITDVVQKIHTVNQNKISKIICQRESKRRFEDKLQIVIFIVQLT